MTSIRKRFSSVLVALAGVFAAAPLEAADDGNRAPEVGVVHAAGDEAWIDLPASLGDTWKATLAELKQRGHVTDDGLSYVESNGQIELDTLWIAVLPGASLDTPITRVRMVVLVSGDEHEQHTAALVGAGALLGAIAQRLPAASPTPAPFSALPAASAEVDNAIVQPVSADDGLVATYNTYNTYNTYDSYYPGYEPYVAPVYVGYAPAVYAWKPWWWLGWCNNNWFFGWNSWGWGSSCWNVGWGWNSCQPWWGYPYNSFCGSVSSCNPWWWDCNDGDSSWDPPNTNPQPHLRDRYNYNHSSPNLSFTRRPGAGGVAGSVATEGTTRTPRITGVKADRSSVSPPSSVGPLTGRHTSGRLATVDTFPTQAAPTSGSGDRSSTQGSRSSRSSRSIVVSQRSPSSSTRAKPGSVTKMKGLTLTTRLGGIYDANSLARSAGSNSAGSSSSPGFSASKSNRPASPFTITSNSSSNAGSSSGSRSNSSRGSHGGDGGGSSASSSSSSHGYPGISSGSSSSNRSSDSSSSRSSGSRSSPSPASVPTHSSRPSSPAPQPAPAPAPRAPAPAPHISGGHASGGGSLGGTSGGGSGRSSGGGGGLGGGGGGGSGRSSGRGPR